jgi:hypothetical protein
MYLRVYIFTGVHLMGVHPISIYHLTGIYLMGMHLIGVYQ